MRGLLQFYLLSLLAGGSLCCRSRSGEDGDRVYSHQGKEPEYAKETTEAPAEVTPEEDPGILTTTT